ncbi:hypothetical protein HA052_04275 [Chromobacterium haemolyticum]|uniref:Uncharacterized protein n=1 Tax=Chromobacterium fluminis TaxID=3044269 RepID=A0ABX0L4Z1_9NEIS|nr:hypothetical protein [Chromobacterium haemolyticum]NHR04406.1 hypothetical protein [Chromobacterium haemolyticum]
MARKVPLKDRIRVALASGERMTYHDLMLAVFPFDEYPKAYRYQSNGGPPGCAMVFGKALREMKQAQELYDHQDAGGWRWIRLATK